FLKSAREPFPDGLQDGETRRTPRRLLRCNLDNRGQSYRLRIGQPAWFAWERKPELHQHGCGDASETRSDSRLRSRSHGYGEQSPGGSRSLSAHAEDLLRGDAI